jgi:pyridoxal biosynthesis lyase PdxS
VRRAPAQHHNQQFNHAKGIITLRPETKSRCLMPSDTAHELKKKKENLYIICKKKEMPKAVARINHYRPFTAAKTPH